MERLGELRSGWVNLLAGVRPEDVPEAVSPLGAIFSSPSADAPMCTWVPGRVLRRRTEPARIGISHSSGPSAVARLAALGLHIPAGWRVSQDHLRRGLVVVVCEGEDASTVAGWMLRAGAALSKLPLTGEWRAEVYERSTR